MNDQTEYLNIEEMAARLKVKPSWLYAQTRRRDANGIPVLRVGKYVRFIETEVVAWARQKNQRC